LNAFDINFFGRLSAGKPTDGWGRGEVLQTSNGAAAPGFAPPHSGAGCYAKPPKGRWNESLAAAGTCR